MSNDRQQPAENQSANFAHRPSGSGFSLASILRDLRYSWRQLARNPGYAITAILTLALGIGASTAVFSVAYGLLIDPFPYHDVHTLATPELCSPEWRQCSWTGYTPAQFNEIEKKTGIFSGVTASTISNVILTGGAEPEQLRGNYITPNTFEVLGVQPISAAPPSRLTSSQTTLRSPCSAIATGRLTTAERPPSWANAQLQRPSPHRHRHHAAALPVARRDVYLPIRSPATRKSRASVTSRSSAASSPASRRPRPPRNSSPSLTTSKRIALHVSRQIRVDGVITFDQMFKSDLASTLHLLLGAAWSCCSSPA